MLLTLNRVTIALLFLAGLAAAAFAVVMLAGVLTGAAADAHLLGFWPWLALVAGTAAVVSAVGYFTD